MNRKKFFDYFREVKPKDFVEIHLTTEENLAKILLQTNILSI